MSASLEELIEQRTSLERRIHEARSLGKTTALIEVRRLMDVHGLTAADILPPSHTTRANPRGQVAPKYRNPADGATWSGRGLKPRWLSAALAKGASLEDYRIASSTPQPAVEEDGQARPGPGARRG